MTMADDLVATPESEVTGINFELLDRAIAHIEAHPEEWDQARWATETDCGTAFCIAGRIAHMLGWEPDFDDEWLYSFTAARTTTGPYRLASLFAKGERQALPWAIAEEALRIDSGRGMALFASSNTLEEIQDLRDRWAVEDGVAPRFHL